MSDGTKSIRDKLKLPIEWIPLEEKDGKTLLISRNVLDWEFYGVVDEIEEPWDSSHMKEWLDELYEQWFSEEEKNAVDKSVYGKLFLLSEEEIVKYMPRVEDRRAILSFFYKKEDEAEVIIECDEIGVRPAIWVDMKKVKNVKTNM